MTRAWTFALARRGGPRGAACSLSRSARAPIALAAETLRFLFKFVGDARAGGDRLWRALRALAAPRQRSCPRVLPPFCWPRLLLLVAAVVIELAAVPPDQSAAG